MRKGRKLKNNKDVQIIKDIIKEVVTQINRPIKQNKASNKRLNKNLFLLGFNSEQIKDIQNSW